MIPPLCSPARHSRTKGACSPVYSRLTCHPRRHTRRPRGQRDRRPAAPPAESGPLRHLARTRNPPLRPNVAALARGVQRRPSPGKGGCGPQRQRPQTPIPVQRVTLGTPSYPITLGHSGCASGPAHHRDWAKRVGVLAGQQACRWHLHVRIVFIILGETSARQQCVMQPRALQPSKLEL